MRFFGDSASLTCKRLLRRPGTLLITLLLPIVCAIAGLYLAGEGEVLGVRVGVGIQPGDGFGERLYAGLARFEGPIVFERHDLDERAYLEREVAAGRMEAAYLISPQLEENLSAGHASGGIEVLSSPRAMLDTLAGEIVLASMLREVSSQVSLELLTTILEMPPEQAEEVASRLYAYYAGREYIFLEPLFAYHRAGAQASGYPPPPVEARALHGIIALFLLAGVIWSLPPLAREVPGILRRLPAGKSRVFMLGVALALTVTGLLQGALGLSAIALTHPAAISSLPVSAVMLASYLLCLGLLGSSAVLLARAGAIYPAGIFVLIFTAVLGGPLIDLGEISPRLAVISIVFPSWHYIDGALRGDLQQLPMLLLFSLVLAGLTMLLARK